MNIQKINLCVSVFVLLTVHGSVGICVCTNVHMGILY